MKSTAKHREEQTSEQDQRITEQARPIPSQAEGDRATVEESLRRHEEKGDLGNNKQSSGRPKK
ncbi:MAG TPA: hypothetical protein VFZ34_10035 [Blastocatellia bacterium]|nr:hypothetical protein [Blastocatellia bacterium]